METNVKNYFTNKKWESGKELYENGMVSSLSTATDNSTIALVKEGYKIFKTSVSVNPITMDCSCDEGKKGRRCKHMAALFIACKNKKNGTFDNVYHIKNYEDCGWYPIIQNYSLSSRNQKIAIYLNHETIGREDYEFDEILSLISFLLKDDPISYSSLKHSIRKLKNLRDALDSDTYIDLDARLLTIIKDNHDKQVCDTLFENYFFTFDAYPSLKRFIEDDHEHIYDDYVLQIFDLDKRFFLPEDEIAQLALSYLHNMEIILWLSSYYFKQEQPEKAEPLLETYLANHDNDLDKNRKMLFPLLKAYLLNKQIDKAFDFSEKIIHVMFVSVPTVFLYLKNYLDEETWNSRGKPMLANWAENESTQLRFDVCKVVREPDLLLFDAYRYIVLSQLYECFDIIYEYDKGATLALLKKCLVMDYNYRKDTPGYFKNVWKDFTFYFPLSDSEFINGLKQILIELRTEKPHLLNFVYFLEDQVHEIK